MSSVFKHKNILTLQVQTSTFLAAIINDIIKLKFNHSFLKIIIQIIE